MYLLESSGILVVLYALYWMLLRKETFFRFNRFFLLVMLAFSFVGPLLRFDESLPVASILDQPLEELGHLRRSYYEALEAWSFGSLGSSSRGEAVGNSVAREEVAPPSLLLTSMLVIYGIGVIALVVRLLGAYAWIRRLKSDSQKEVMEGVTVVKVSRPIAPFSFLTSVFIHEDVIQSQDFDQILAHERVHIREGHSIDLLVVQLAAAVLWFNPVVWWLIKSLKTTHEYLVDEKMMNQGYSFVTYQTLLLSQLVSNHSYGLVHHFNLSFIKKRIIMMNTKRSGWVGNVKVALTLSAVLVFSVVIVQCQATLDEQGLQEPAASSDAEAAPGLSLPTLPETEHPFQGNLDQAVPLTISEGRVTIDDETIEVDEIASWLAQKPAERNVVVARIDRAQSMALVRAVQEELRQAGRLKLLYVGQTAAGQPVEMTFLLPPTPGEASGPQPPIITPQYAQENDIDLLKMDLSKGSGASGQQEVYDFVKDQMAAQKSNYVVSARFSDTDTYDSYLVNLFHIKAAFYQIYDERAQALYGKRFREIAQNRSADKQYQAMYDAVRQGVPMAISVAEN